MGHVAATVTDAVDMRALDCTLPDDVEVASVAARLAELLRLPIVGPDGYPLNYGLVPREGRLLPPDACLDDFDLDEPVLLRLVPEIVTGQDDRDLFTEPAPGVERDLPDSSFRIEVIEERSLVHDDDLDSRLDVRIDAAVHKEIERFASRDRLRECAGLLVGKVESEGAERIVHITGMIPAHEAEGSRTSVRITHEAWEGMLRARDIDCSDLRILGWFHTHAGWGVFLSDADVFVHRHFFPHPNMVAFVLDPTVGRDGFFYWHDGKIGLCASYGLVSVAERSRHVGGAGRRLRRKFDWRDVLIGALLLFALYVMFVEPLAAKFRSSIVEKERIAARTDGSTEAEVSEPAKPAAKPVPKPVEPPQDRIYGVAVGDNWWKISNRVYHDGELGPALARYNGLTVRSTLRVGQQLKLPPKEKLK